MTYIPADKEVILESCSIEKDSLRSPSASTITVFSGKTGCGGDAQQPYSRDIKYRYAAGKTNH